MVNFLLYLITFIISLVFRKNEQVLTGIVFILLLCIFWLKQDVHLITASLIFGVGMSTVEYTCIRYGMWKYKNVRYTIPLWLPILWIIVFFFAVDFEKAMSSLKTF